MHTFEANGGTTFVFNSDFSGKILVNGSAVPRLSSDVIHKEAEEPGTIEIPGSDILEFVAYCYVRSKKVSKLGNMDAEEILTM